MEIVTDGLIPRAATVSHVLVILESSISLSAVAICKIVAVVESQLVTILLWILWRNVLHGLHWGNISIVMGTWWRYICVLLLVIVLVIWGNHGTSSPRYNDVQRNNEDGDQNDPKQPSISEPTATVVDVSLCNFNVHGVEK